MSWFRKDTLSTGGQVVKFSPKYKWPPQFIMRLLEQGAQGNSQSMKGKRVVPLGQHDSVER